jgi:glycosyltransferase involved in cell wall biosynthesis
MSSAPAVTVLLAVYKPDPTYFREAVASVMAQTFADWELLVVEDESPSISAAALLTEFDDRRIRHHLNPRRHTLASALNEGLRMARAPLVARLDGDDVCEPERLAQQVRYLREHPEVTVYGSRITVIDERGALLGRRLLPTEHATIAASLQRFNCISHPSVMFRREAVLAAGGYDDDEQVEDWELWCRMLTRGARFAASPSALIRYRFHAGALKFENVHGVIRRGLEIKRRYFASRLTMSDRLRMFAEQMLLLAPPRLILWLFRRSQYRAFTPSAGQR